MSQQENKPFECGEFKHFLVTFQSQIQVAVISKLYFARPFRWLWAIDWDIERKRISIKCDVLTEYKVHLEYKLVAKTIFDNIKSCFLYNSLFMCSIAS